MTFLDFDGIASGESIVVEGTIKFIFSDNTCHVDIVDPFPENEDALRSFTSIDIHFHCFDDIDSTTEEADESGFLAFQVDDAVVVLCKIEGNYPDRSLDPIAVTGFVGEVRACWRKAVFRSSGNFFLADIDGDAATGFAFVDLVNTGLAGDDIHFVSRRYWRCSGGVVTTGTVNSQGVNNSDEVVCTGFSQDWVRAIDVYDTSDETGPSFNMLYQYDEDPDDWGLEGVVLQANSTDGIVWDGHTVEINAELCLEQKLRFGTFVGGTVEWYPATNAGFFETTDAFAFTITNGSIRLFRIGRKYRYTVDGDFSDYEAWAAVGSGTTFVEERPFTVEGLSITDGNVQILQVIDPIPQ